MKKILNDANDYADEALEGLCLAFPDYYERTGETGRVIMRQALGRKGKLVL